MENVSLKGQYFRKLRTKRVSMRTSVFFSISREIDVLGMYPLNSDQLKWKS